MTANQFAAGLTEQDLANAINKRKQGEDYHVKGAGNFIQAVDAVTKAVPHSNNAAKAARRNGEAYAHHFGFPSFFLSVTPDDESSYFVLVHSLESSGMENFDPSNMTDEELSKHATLRHKLRIELPGLCAYFFERALDIVVEHIIGWNDRENKPHTGGGIFGTPLAYFAAVEEQGRRSLHAHILVWIEGLESLQRGIYDQSSLVVRNTSKRKLEEIVDKVVTTEMIAKRRCYNKKFTSPKGPFQHRCSTVTGRHESKPLVVNDQSLRNLRNRKGSLNCNGAFAYCGSCTTVWSGPSLLSSYLKDGAKIPHFSSFPDESQRLKSMLLKYQMQKSDAEGDAHITDSAYNFHIHTSSCFKDKITNPKRKKDSDPETEARDKERRDECLTTENTQDCV